MKRANELSRPEIYKLLLDQIDGADEVEFLMSDRTSILFEATVRSHSGGMIRMKGIAYQPNAMYVGSAFDWEMEDEE